MKKLDKLHWTPRWVSHLGCVKGCLNYLGVEITDAWLYGGTGHAFVINVNPESCPSGPTAWRTMMLGELAPNLGYQVDIVLGLKGENFLSTQEKAWSFTRQAIDDRLPVYAWELEIPEYYVIYGYDEVGYYYSGPGADDGKGPKPWQELGDSGIGIIEVYRLQPVLPKEPSVVVKSAFQNILNHASNPPDWIFEGYASGIKAYDLWINGLENGRASRSGMGYNAAVWAECRRFGVEFLEEANQRLGIETSDLFAEALRHYRKVAKNLDQLTKLYPFQNMNEEVCIQPDADCQAAADLLREARGAEAAGLESMEKIAEAL